VDGALAVLRREFESVEGSFLLRLGCDLVWDRAAFSRLEQAMRVLCEQYEGRDDLPRWLAEDFWDVSRSVTDWTSHPNFPRPQPAQYHHDCLERLQNLVPTPHANDQHQRSVTG
jgi:hypothetical protein